MITTYIIECEGNRYYVGRTHHEEDRILQHFENNGSEWTKKYKPIRVVSKFISNDNFDEEKYTLKYMEKYGIDNVRGGSYCTLVLSAAEKAKAQQTIRSITDKCYKCGEKGHFAKQCKKMSCEEEEESGEDENYEDEESQYDIINNKYKYKFITKEVSIFPMNFPKTTIIFWVDTNESEINMCTDIIVDCENNFTEDEKRVIDKFNISSIDSLIRNKDISQVDKTRSLKCLSYVRGKYSLTGIEPCNGHNPIQLEKYLIDIRIQPDGHVKYCKSLGQRSNADFHLIGIAD
jgi:hypothetical protein